MDMEMKSLERNVSFKFIPLPADRKSIMTKCVEDVKMYENGMKIRKKDQLLSRVFTKYVLLKG